MSLGFFCGEDEQAATIAKYIQSLNGGDSDKFLNECEALVSKGDYHAFIEKALSQHKTIFSDENEQDVDSCFGILCNLLCQVEVAKAPAIVQKFTEIVTADTKDRPLLRLRILGSLYNILDVHSEMRYGVFSAIVNFSAASNNLEMVSSHFGDVEEWAAAWGVSVDKVRALYLAIADAVASTGQNRQGHEVLVKYLKTFEGKESEITEDVKSQAVKVAIEAIKIPDMYRFDHLLDLVVVQKLKDDKKHSSVHELLSIFVHDKLEAYKKFHSKNGALLKTHGLSHDACLQKMQLLSIASLADEQAQVPYSVIASTLHIDEDQVELWVIEAITANFLDAKIDQLKKTVIINRCMQRSFTQAQWKTLQSKLESWKTNVHDILGVIAAAKERQQEARA